jgi:hypothetical protein
MAKPKHNASDHSPPTGAEINNRNWGEVFGAAIRARGGVGFVIRNQEPKIAGPATPAEWHAWMIYFEDHGISTRFMRSYGVATVPTQWPEDFEAGREESDRGWQFPPRPSYDPYMRARVARLFRELAHSIDPGLDAREHRRRPQTPQEAAEALAGGFPHLKGPVTLSPAVRARLGLDQ